MAICLDDLSLPLDVEAFDVDAASEASMSEASEQDCVVVVEEADEEGHHEQESIQIDDALLILGEQPGSGMVPNFGTNFVTNMCGPHTRELEVPKGAKRVCSKYLNVFPRTFGFWAKFLRKGAK